MDGVRDRETLLRRRRELYQRQRERETPEEREVRLSRRKEYYRHWRAALSTEQQESILQQRRAAYNTNAQVDYHRASITIKSIAPHGCSYHVL